MKVVKLAKDRVLQCLENHGKEFGVYSKWKVIKGPEQEGNMIF